MLGTNPLWAKRRNGCFFMRVTVVLVAPTTSLQLGSKMGGRTAISLHRALGIRGAGAEVINSLAFKRDRQSNGSDGDKERRCKKTAGLQRTDQSCRPRQHVEDKFARAHYRSAIVRA
jgi:hypothetical protein